MTQSLASYLIDNDVVIRRPVNLQALRIMRPAYDHERAPQVATFAPQPEKASESEVRRMMLDAQRRAEDLHAAQLRGKRPRRRKVSMRYRATHVLKSHGIREPTKEQIKLAIECLRVGDGSFLAAIR